MRKQVCALTPDQASRRGVLWIIGSFVLCPCHLPITLWVAAAVLSGTAAGAALYNHVYLAGVVLGVTWLSGTIHGFNLMRRARIDAYTSNSGSHIVLK
ncbi:MAG TPA: hypothetical protein VG871_03880 [Vicinamibacterales bacterium]|nr:hypothetical protein [Vicinamibacterales bacterium]